MLQSVLSLLPWKTLAKLALGKWLQNEKTKQALMVELRALALSTETKFDDAAVDAFAEVWEVAIPVLIKKL